MQRGACLLRTVIAGSNSPTYLRGSAPPPPPRAAKSGQQYHSLLPAPGLKLRVGDPAPNETQHSAAPAQQVHTVRNLNHYGQHWQEGWTFMSQLGLGGL